METTMQAMKVTYTKLKDGSWGLRVEGTVSEGTQVTVEKKNRETKQEVVGKVLWTDGRVSICKIAARFNGRPSYNGGGTYRGRNYMPRGCCSECGTRLESWMDGYNAGLCHDCL